MFVLNWQYAPGVKAYLTKRSPDRKPYTSDPHDKDCKTWQTRGAVERFLKGKDKGWAADCVIEEV